MSFVVPKGLHPGPTEVIASYKGQRGNAVGMEIIEKPLRPVVATTAVLAAGGMPPDRTSAKLAGNDLGWRPERGATTRLSVHPLVDPLRSRAGFAISLRSNLWRREQARVKTTKD